MIENKAIFLGQVSKLIFTCESDYRIDWEDAFESFGFLEILEKYPEFINSHFFLNEDYLPMLKKIVKDVYKNDSKNALDMFHFIFEMYLAFDDYDFLNCNWLSDFLEYETSDILVFESKSKYLEIETVPDDFYRELIDLINKCYSLELYVSVSIFSRKILENLLVDVLRKKYGNNDIQMFYNPNLGRFHGFNTLIQNFKDKLDDFQLINPKLDSSFIQDMNQFRELGNSSAHTLELKVSKNDIDNKSDLKHLINILIRLFNNIN